MDVVNHPKTQAILQNPDLLRLIWTTVMPDMKDLITFLETAKSPKYDPERILGRWNFDVNIAMAMYLRTNLNISSRDMHKVKERIVATFSKTGFVAKTDHQVTLRNVPQVRPLAVGAGPIPALQTIQGQWKNLDGKYQITLSAGGKEGELAATVEGDRLTITGEGIVWVFAHED